MARLNYVYKLSDEEYQQVLIKTVAQYAKSNMDKVNNHRNLLEAAVFADSQSDLDIINELSKHSESWVMNG